MIKVAAALNSFASEPEATAPPEEIFVLSAGQLEAIILQAVERATAPLEARLDALEERGVGSGKGGEAPQDGQEGLDQILQVVSDLKEQNSALNAKLEGLQEVVPWVEALSRKIARLEAPKISQKTEARAEKIAKYLKERPDHKATYETLRGHLGIDKRRLNEAIKLLRDSEPGKYGIVRPQGDKRGRILVMLPK
jgi:hypothetical protein